MYTPKSSVTELCPNASSPRCVLASAKTLVFPLTNVAAYFFPLDSCSNEFFPSHMFLCLPLHRKQALKPEGQMNLLICSNLKHRPQAVAALLLHGALLPACRTLPGTPSLSSARTLEHSAAEMPRMFSAPAWGQEPSATPSGVQIKNMRARVSCRVGKLFSFIIWSWPRA